MPLLAFIFALCLLLPTIGAATGNEVILNNMTGDKKVIILKPSTGTSDIMVIQKPEAVVCSQEIGTCPDGTRVMRSGPNCEFPACPTKAVTGQHSQQPCQRDVRRCPDGTDVYRAPPLCEFMPCAAGMAPSGQVTAQPPTRTICTMEARICPDGTAVSRTGPNCEFAPCPSQRR